MISNTEAFYRRARDYQTARKKVMDAYEARIADLEANHKGSKYYEEQVPIAEETKDTQLKALKEDCGDALRLLFDSMKKANDTRPLQPPTEEELRTLQLLKLKEKVTEEELTRAAHTLKGNEACLSVLTDIGHKQGIITDFSRYADSSIMSTQTVNNHINTLESETADFLQFDTSRAARIAQAHHDTMYGTPEDAPALPKRAIFDGKAECFKLFAGLEGKELQAFCDAVDG